MASELSKLTAAVQRLTLADGNEYLLSPITLEDYGQIDVMLADFVVQRAERVYAKAPDDIKRRGLEAAYLEAEHITFASVDGARILVTPAGTAWLLYFSIKPNHPDMTMVKVMKLVTAATLEYIQTRLDEANGVKKADPTISPFNGTEMPIQK